MKPRHKIPLITGRNSSAVVFGDRQSPFHDKRAFRLLLKFIVAVKPDALINLGDDADCFWWSTYPKKFGSIRPPRLRYGWNASGEVRAVRDDWAAIKEASGGAKRYYLMGNHEERCRRIVQNQTPAIETDGTDFRSVFGAGDFWDHVYDYGDAIRLGHLWFTHGHLVRVHTAKSMLDQWGTSVVFGHVHRWELYSRRTKNGEHHAAFGVPCLCDLDAHYLALPNWSQGFAHVTWTPTGLFSLTTIPILPGYHAVFGGIQFSA